MTDTYTEVSAETRQIYDDILARVVSAEDETTLRYELKQAYVLMQMLLDMQCACLEIRGVDPETLINGFAKDTILSMRSRRQ